MAVDLLFTRIRCSAPGCPWLAVDSSSSVGPVTILAALSVGAGGGGVEAVNEGGGARVLDCTDDGALLTAGARIAREAARTARVHPGDPGRGPGDISAKVAQSDRAVVAGGGAEVAVDEFRRYDAVHAVVGSVCAAST